MERSILGLVLDLSRIDLEDIAIALADQNDYEHHWLISPDTEHCAAVRQARRQRIVAAGELPGALP